MEFQTSSSWGLLTNVSVSVHSQPQDEDEWLPDKAANASLQFGGMVSSSQTITLSHQYNKTQLQFAWCLPRFRSLLLTAKLQSYWRRTLKGPVPIAEIKDSTALQPFANRMPTGLFHRQKTCSTFMSQFCLNTDHLVVCTQGPGPKIAHRFGASGQQGKEQALLSAEYLFSWD